MSHEAMARVAEQRERLAERARLPWWFWVLFTAATVGLVGGPLIQRWIGVGAGTFLVLWPSLLVYLLADRLVRHARGISLSSRVLRDYPSARLPGALFLVAAVIGVVVVLATVHAAPGVAVVALVVATAAAVGAMVGMQRGMRADIRAGRVRSA